MRKKRGNYTKYITHSCILELMARPKNSNKRNVTLMVDGIIYDHYADSCRRNGILISQQVEILMEKHMREEQEK